MGKEYSPPLTQDELQRAANAAAAIVTRCNMVSNDGFVNANQLLTLVQRKVTRGSNLEVDLEGLSAVLAHPTIRRVLDLYGFKFQMYKGEGDRWFHNSSKKAFRMYRIGSNISGRKFSAPGSIEEMEQVVNITQRVLEACGCTSPVSEAILHPVFV